MSGQSVVLGKKNGKANGDEDEEMFGITWFLLNNSQWTAQRQTRTTCVGSVDKKISRSQ